MAKEPPLYWLEANGCTFWIMQTLDTKRWKLMYRVPMQSRASGHYEYAERDTPQECCELLARADSTDEQWILLQTRVPMLLAPPPGAETLNNWWGANPPGTPSQT